PRGAARRRRAGSHLPAVKRPHHQGEPHTHRPGPREGHGAMSTETVVDTSRRRFSTAWFQSLAIRYAMVIVLLLVIAFFAYRSARFGTVDNVVTILVAAAPFALIALGQTLVILTGGI